MFMSKATKIGVNSMLILLPNKDFRCCTFQAGGSLQSIDKSLRLKIKELVEMGIYNVEEIRIHLQQTVKAEFAQSLPDESNRRFWPSNRDILNHVQIACEETMLVVQQVNLL